MHFTSVLHKTNNLEIADLNAHVIHSPRYYGRATKKEGDLIGK
jgi:hypothetical protein